MARKNPMKYFSGSAVSRLPLYKLIAGGMPAASFLNFLITELSFLALSTL